MSHVWHDPRFTSVDCFACGAAAGQPCTIPGLFTDETADAPCPKRIRKLVENGTIDAKLAGEYPYDEYIDNYLAPDTPRTENP